MCGIFGMVGANAVTNTLRALKLLEYRGYDSAGIAAKRDGEICIYKSAGRISNLQRLVPMGLESNVAIGHTRWATHGAVSTENAHPFYSPDRRFAVVHNGIIENYLDIKQQFTLRGAVFTSQTDSETVAHLLQRYYSASVLDAVLKTANSLVGSFAIAVASNYDNNLYAIKNKSPLVVGVSSNGVYLCSDIRSLSHWADKVAIAPDKSVVVVGNSGVNFYDFDGKQLDVAFFAPNTVNESVQTDGELMLKEIYEIPSRIRLAKQGYFADGGLQIDSQFVKRCKRIYLIGCGTAYNSGLQIATVARKLLDVDVLPVIASEFIYDSYPIDSDTLAVLISQSGETADTIRAAEKVRLQGGYAYAVTNTDSSSLRYTCNGYANVYAGGEYAVASTKAYNCQLVTLLLIVLDIAQIRKTVDEITYTQVVQGLDELPQAVEQILDNSNEIARIAWTLKDSSAIFYIGRTCDYPTAAEGSLKLKEISYVHSEAYPAGELKHGTLALMEKGVTVIAICTETELLGKMSSSVNEVITRGADVVGVSVNELCNTHNIVLPKVHPLLYGIVSVVPLQLLAYYVAKGLGRDVDKPRNLAKSVTVE